MVSVLRYPPSSCCTSCWLRVGGAPPLGRSAEGQRRQGPKAGEPQVELGSEQGPQELQGQSHSQGPEGCRAVGIQTSLGCLSEGAWGGQQGRVHSKSRQRCPGAMPGLGCPLLGGPGGPSQPHSQGSLGTWVLVFVG